MATKVVTYEDFSGGHYRGGNDARQPMNTWRGVDVDISPSTGFLLRRDENLYPSGVKTATSQAQGSQIDSANWNWSAYSPAALTNPAEDHASGAPVMSDGGSNVTPSGTYEFLFWWQKTGSSSTGGSIVSVAWNTGWSRAWCLTPVTGYPTGNISTWRTSSQVYALFPYMEAGVAKLRRYESLAASWATITPLGTWASSGVAQVGVWGEWLFGVGHKSALLAFSLATSLGATFGSGGITYQIGDSSPIYSVTEDGDRLIIGKRDGWFAFSGDPADVDTVTIRRISNAAGPAIPPLVATKFLRGVASQAAERGVLFSSSVGLLSADLDGSTPQRVGASGVSRFSGATSTTELAIQHSSVVESVAGVEHVADSCQMLIVNPQEATGVVPYPPGGVGHWISKEGRWFHWSSDGLPADATPVADQRRQDLSPREKIWFLSIPASSGSQLTYRLAGINAYSDLPTSWKPIQIELAPYNQAQPFTIKSVFVEFDYGPLQLSTGSGYYGMAKCSAKAGIVGVDAGDIAWSTEAVVEKEVVGGLDGADGDNLRRKTALVKLLPNDLPAGNEVVLQITLGGARLRRVTMVIDEEPWPS